MAPLVPLLLLAAGASFAQMTPVGVPMDTGAPAERVDYKKSVTALKVVCPGAASHFSCIGSADVCGGSYAQRAKKSPQWSGRHAADFGLDECHHAVLLGSEGFNFQGSKDARKYPEAFEVVALSYTDFDGKAHTDKGLSSIVDGKPSGAPSSLTSEAELNGMLKAEISSGNTWDEDGADTFFAAYQDNAAYRGDFDAKFQKEFGRPFRHETKAEFVKKLRALPIGAKLYSKDLPDFIYDESARNEPATRFGVTVDSLLAGGTMASAVAKPESPGDPGGGYYGSLPAQYFITASMQKLAEDRIVKAVAWLKAQKPAAGKALDALASDLKSDPEVRMFWQKAFYNGAQGRQASGVKLLLKLTVTGAVARKESYLGGGAGSLTSECEVYANSLVSASGYRACGAQ